MWHMNTLASYWGMWVISCSCLKLFWESKETTRPPRPPTSEFGASGSDVMIFVPKLRLHFTQMIQTNCGVYSQAWMLNGAAAFRASDEGCVCDIQCRGRSSTRPGTGGKAATSMSSATSCRRARSSAKPWRACHAVSGCTSWSYHTEQNLAHLHKLSGTVCESFIAFRKTSLDLLGDSIKKMDSVFDHKNEVCFQVY